ncbi:hypothetical protein [uncultured Pelagimonas sp.]|uniref:hypothetical protein n=1 Tax=uncultured Pelagimonas sp. TaxID=1618102 RepID=UPI002638D852|nr:hypothetical protein [uncultured Pelagimonas sp.]
MTQIWNAELWGIIGGIAGTLGLLALVQAWWHRREDNLRSDISSAPYRAKLIQRYDCDKADRDYISLRLLLDWADRFYGPSLSYQALNRCLSLAFVYPLVAAFFAWLVFNSGSPGGLELFRDIPVWHERLWRGAVLFATIVVTGLMITNVPKIHRGIAGLFNKNKDAPPQSHGFLAKAWLWGGETL